MYNLVNVILLVVIAYQIRTIYLSYKAPNIIPEELPLIRKETKGKMYVIDVRSVGQFNKGHIKGSKNIPFGDLYQQMEKVSKTRKIILVSQRGTQTGRAVTKLEKDGFDVVNLKGGYKAWAKYQKE